jgi:hypothetical protein
MVPPDRAGIPCRPDAVKCSASMTAATQALTRQMLEWIAARPREYSEVMETWRTSCPRLSIWEDACIDGFIDHEPGTGKIILSAAGREFLSRPNLTSA